MNRLPAYGSTVVLEMTSAEPEETLSSLTLAGIRMQHIEKQDDLTYTLSVSRGDFAHLQEICRKRGCKIKVLHSSGLYCVIKNACSRKLLMFGLAFLLCLSLFLPTRIFFVKVQGNQTIPARQILEAAQESGISFGTSRRAVRSEKVKNALLSRMPQLKWVGVNTAGCVATVSVRERENNVSPEKEYAVSSIAASRDGYILSMTVNNGTALCAPGQYVREGQILVSGYTDCGIYIQAARSEAEIMAQTNRRLEVITPIAHHIRSGKALHKQKYSLLIGKKRINLWKDSGIMDSTCGRIYKEKYATLPGGFRLPIALCIETFIQQDTISASHTQQEVSGSLSSCADLYLRQEMNAGSILSRSEQITSAGGTLLLEGDYVCQEMIGRVKREQIGE